MTSWRIRAIRICHFESPSLQSGFQEKKILLYVNSLTSLFFYENVFQKSKGLNHCLTSILRNIFYYSATVVFMHLFHLFISILATLNIMFSKERKSTVHFLELLIPGFDQLLSSKRQDLCWFQVITAMLNSRWPWFLFSNINSDCKRNNENQSHYLQARNFFE